MGSALDFLGALALREAQDAQAALRAKDKDAPPQRQQATRPTAKQPARKTTLVMTKKPSAARPVAKKPQPVTPAAAAKALSSVPKTVANVAMKKVGTNLATLNAKKTAVINAAAQKTNAAQQKSVDAATSAATTAANRALAAGQKLAKKNPKAGQKLVALAQKHLTKIKTTAAASKGKTHVGQMFLAYSPSLATFQQEIAQINAWTAEDNALSQAADLATTLTDAVNQLTTAGQTALASSGQALIQRCMDVINNYDPDVGDPNVVSVVAQIQADATAWQTQVQQQTNGAVSVSVSTAGTKAGTPAVTSLVSSLQAAGQAAMSSGQQLMQVASMTPTAGVPMYSMPAAPTATGTYPTTVQGYMGMDPMTLAQTAQTVGQQALTVAQQGQALAAGSDATVWMTQANTAQQAAQAVSSACQQAYMVASAAAQQAGGQYGGGGYGGGDSGGVPSGGGYDPYADQGGYDQGYDDQGGGGDQGGGDDGGYGDDGGGDDGGGDPGYDDGSGEDDSGDDGYDDGGDDSGDDYGDDYGDDQDPRLAADNVMMGKGGGGHGGGHGGHGHGHGRRGRRDGGFWAALWDSDCDGFDYLDATDLDDDEVTVEDVVAAVQARKARTVQDESSTVIGDYDIAQSQQQMNALKQVTVGIARTLVKHGEQVANETILQAQGLGTTAEALAVATSGGITSNLPGITSLKNTLGHLKWHEDALSKLGDANAIYASGDDLKKWTMQAFIDSNSVEEGRKRQEEIWQEMWAEIGDAIAKLPAKIVKAVAAIPGQVFEAATGIPSWVFWTVGGVILFGVVGLGVWRIVKVVRG